MSYITTCGGTPQARARPVRPAPSQTRPGVPCAVPPQSLQSCPRNNGATPATCARSAAQCSRSSRLSAGRTSRAPASSRGKSPWEAPRRGKLLARRCQRIFSSQNGVKELTSKRRRRNGDSLWADHHGERGGHAYVPVRECQGNARQAHPFLNEVHFFGILGES